MYRASRKDATEGIIIQPKAYQLCRNCTLFCMKSDIYINIDTRTSCMRRKLTRSQEVQTYTQLYCDTKKLHKIARVRIECITHMSK